MPLEDGDKISDLNPLWPLGTDQKSQGDDHIRLLKKIVQGDALSLADGGDVVGPVTFDGSADFAQSPTVPDGATGKQAVNADDVPALAGTGPVEIVGADVTSGWQVWGDVLIQWGISPAATTHTVVFAQSFKTKPAVVASALNEQNNFPRNVTVQSADTTQFTADVDQTNGSLAVHQIGWIAIGEAPDALKKPKIVQTVGSAPDAPQDGDTYGRKDGDWSPITQEFHDPAGVASWRIVGNTLECWGVAERILAADPVTVNFPKTFKRDPTVQVTAVGNITTAISALWGSLTPSSVLVTAKVAATNANNNSDVVWYVIGEWDGVS